MTPKKDKETHRDPTVVYPDTSPSLRLAYRIFGPGHNEPEKLDSVKDKMFIRGVPEAGESWLTPLGQEIQRNLDLSVEKILEAYSTYKREIERMNRWDNVHKKRKQARLDRDEDGGDWVADLKTDGKIKSVVHDWAEGEDPYEQFWKDPALWLNKEEALVRTRAMRGSVAEMNATLRKIQGFCERRMGLGNDIHQALARCEIHLHDLIAYSEGLEEVIRMHEGKSRGTTWESRDRPGVTFGPKVPWAIHRVYELDERLDSMKPVLAACERTQNRLASTKLLTTTKVLHVELRVKLVRFAALCLAEEARNEFEKEFEEELKQRGKSSSPLGNCIKAVAHKNAKAPVRE
ncbi:hypothetical protein INS49_013250 [Diaporthe citri]|uniref:uncharacterized protein n=1 Tax=Diaporthe citri TaxID=83186 RepID=UPI001C816DE0|nr:uncharacterized protein INS49_013250 [Diaporthe citri]KAG6357373.1 hypothetical protein INS49_013250 [Diaporthe citri]